MSTNFSTTQVGSTTTATEPGADSNNVTTSTATSIPQPDASRTLLSTVAHRLPPIVPPSLSAFEPASEPASNPAHNPTPSTDIPPTGRDTASTLLHKPPTPKPLAVPVPLTTITPTAITSQGNSESNKLPEPTPPISPLVIHGLTIQGNVESSRLPEPILPMSTPVIHNPSVLAAIISIVCVVVIGASLALFGTYRRKRASHSL